MNSTSDIQFIKTLSIMLICGFGLMVEVMGITTTPYSHTVTRRKPMAYGKYIVRTDDSTAELITNCGAPDEFKPETDTIVFSRKHDVMWTIPVRNDAALSRAVSPMIPGNDSSYVFVKGQFQSGDGGGGRGGAGGPAVLPQWGSMLKEPGVHVILMHQYDADYQGDPDFNQDVRLSGAALRTQYAGDGHKVLLVKVGVGGDIADISGLPAYLASQEVEHGTVVTLDTLGHGERFKYSYTLDSLRVTYTFKFLKSARPSDVNTIGRTEDSTAAQKIFPMPTAAFCGTFNDYLRDGAVVGLWHCYTAEGYRSPVPVPEYNPSAETYFVYAARTERLLRNPPTIPSIMGQTIAALKSGVVVAGVRGTVEFRYLPKPDDLVISDITK